MTVSALDGMAPFPPVADFTLPDFETSWVGCDLAEGLIFGSYEGRVRHTTAARETLAEYFPFAEAEPVNSVAVAAGRCLVTTPVEMAVVIPAGNLPSRCAGVQFGAHHAVACGDTLAAACNLSGIFLMRAAADSPKLNATFIRSDERPLPFYRLLPLPGDRILAVCGRSGFVVTSIAEGPEEGKGRHFVPADGSDFVGVATLAPAGLPIGAVMLSRDGRLAFIRDVLNPGGQYGGSSIRPDEFAGVAYDVLCVGRDVVVQTSGGVYILPDAAGRFAAGRPADEVISHVYCLPEETVSVFALRDRWLVVEAPEGLRRFDLHDIRTTWGGLAPAKKRRDRAESTKWGESAYKAGFQSFQLT